MPEPHGRATVPGHGGECAAERDGLRTELGRERRLQDLLLNATTSEDVEKALAEAVEELTGHGVAVTDAHGHLLASTHPGGAPGAEGAPWPTRIAAVQDGGVGEDRTAWERARRADEPARVADVLVVLAAPRGEVLGRLLLHDPHTTADEFVRRVLDGAARVLGVEMRHRREVAETELRARRDLVDDLLNPDLDRDARAGAADRARRLGHDPDRPHRVLAVAAANQPLDARAPRAELLTAVERAARRMRMTCLVSSRGSVVLVIAHRPATWRSPDEPPVREPLDVDDRRWGELLDTIATELHSPRVALGIGGFCADSTGLPRSHQQASRALAARQGSGNPYGFTLYDQLGLQRILLSSTEARDETATFVQEWLGALMDYDTDRSSDLVTTLGAFLDHGGNYDATARAVLIHRSTLRYRLQRIQEISGHVLADIDTRLHLHLATRARVMLSPGSASPR